MLAPKTNEKQIKKPLPFYLFAIFCFLACHPSRPSSYPRPPTPATRATSYFFLNPITCQNELNRRQIRWQAAEAVAGVRTPVRLMSPLHGIQFHSPLPPSKRNHTLQEIFDCRMLLALDDFAALLAPYRVVEVIYISAYRHPPPHWTLQHGKTRHPAGLAIDIATFIFSDGSSIQVKDHFYGRIGDTTCGSKANPPTSLIPQALILRKIICKTATAKVFNVLLTPNYNAAHRDHFHFDISHQASFFVR
ncbi:extensin family protein [Pajaroellobacter abortibovis]|uniref:Extensin-like C-terminal domain-containing protein n=1 Tax=Pajaroellobacter abortibovis TaxID=1882918 RepID=A0A1L6MWV5_9BACT|nr:extensin family protein [Pajaroellobacter abortibovis]APR99897.1 hypothetical protein BCY86_03790 [Pajaroellobacter abortibovis]